MRQSGIFTVCVLFLVCAAHCAGGNYSDQGNWTGDCNNGTWQTPIDIQSRVKSFCPHEFGYHKITFICDDFPVDYNGSDVSITVDRKVFAFFVDEDMQTYQAYESYNAHFHTPSEHHLNGESLAAEMHIKLRPTTYDMLPPEALGRYQDFNLSNFTEDNHFHSVVGFMFTEDENVTEDFFDYATYENGTNFTVNDTPTFWNMHTMAGCLADNFWYEYIGSTTTPPCTQDVRWLISRAPLPIKPVHLEQIKNLKADFTNSRDIQPLNDRVVKLFGKPCEMMMN